METTGNGNGYMKPVVIGVAVFVLGAVIVGAGGTSVKNTVVNHEQQVQIDTTKEDMAEQKAAVAKIPVMDERIKDIKEDVAKILEALKK
jgi:hypothetical protein